MNEISFDNIQLKHPFTMMVVGPTMCGKTEWVSKLITHRNRMIYPSPEKVVWSYKTWQSAYTRLSNNENVTFIQGMEINFTDNKIPTLVIIDDQMSDVNEKVVDWFTRGCHHDNISLIFITQNLFFPDKKFRTASLNCHYLLLFRNPRDNYQIRHLARQMYPGKKNKCMVEAFEDATTQNTYGYLLVDLKPCTPDTLRLRTNILPMEGLKIQDSTDQEGLTQCYGI